MRAVLLPEQPRIVDSTSPVFQQQPPTPQYGLSQLLFLALKFFLVVYFNISFFSASTLFISYRFLIKHSWFIVLKSLLIITFGIIRFHHYKINFLHFNCIFNFQLHFNFIISTIDLIGA